MANAVAVRNRNTRGVDRFGRTTVWAVPGQSYVPGTLVQVVGLNSQPGTGLVSGQNPAAGANKVGLIGIVADDFVSYNQFAKAVSGGFDNKGGTTCPAQGALGTFNVPIIWHGPHLGVQLDCSGGNNISNGTTLVSSANTAGYMQGATSVALGMCAEVIMASAAPFNTIAQASLAAATQTITVTGTPVAGEVYTIPFQTPFNDNAYGTAQYYTLSLTLTTAQAASVTTAAAAIVSALTASTYLSNWYSATNVAGVVTVTVVSNPFRINFAGLTNLSATYGASAVIYSSGAAGNWLSLGAMTTSSTSTLTAGGSNSGYAGYPATSPLFASGTGYKGPWPALVKL